MVLQLMQLLSHLICITTSWDFVSWMGINDWMESLSHWCSPLAEQWYSAGTVFHFLTLLRSLWILREGDCKPELPK